MRKFIFDVATVVLNPDPLIDGSRADPTRLGVISVSAPGLGLPDTEVLFAYPVRPPRKHKIPRPGETVLIQGHKDGNEYTLFWLGVVSTQSKPPPGHELIESPTAYSHMDIEDFGQGRIVYNPETTDFTLTLTGDGGDLASITFNATSNQISVQSGSGDVLFNGGGPRFALQGDTVVAGEHVGSIVSGTAPCQGRFPR